MTKNTPEKRLSLASSGARGHGFSASMGMAAAVANERRASANQEQAAAPPPSQTQPQPQLRSRLQQRRTALEQLLDIELDSEGANNRHVEQDNQEHAAEEDPALQNVSLELLALLSPHGTTQQWEDDDYLDEEFTAKEPQSMIADKKPTQLPRPTELKNHRYGVPDVTSPTELTAPFAPSPIHSADGDEFDMASPLALPDDPQRQEQWNSSIRIDYEDEQADASVNEPGKDPKPSSTKKESSSRASPSTFPRRTARTSHSPQPQTRTPGKGSHYANALESKPKIRHGGIYSLLLKNKPPENEPMLVIDEKRSPQGPEVSPMPHSVSKKSSPPSFGKIQHGGIYGMLRRNSKNAD